MKKSDLIKCMKSNGINYSDTLISKYIRLFTKGEAGKSIYEHILSAKLLAHAFVDRQTMHEDSHSFGFSKIMWLNALEDILNEYWNKNGICVKWRCYNEEKYEILFSQKQAA